MSPAPVDDALPPVTHVAIEATRFLQERRGIGRYLRETVRALLPQQPALGFTWFVQRRGDEASLHALLGSIDAALPSRSAIRPIDALPETRADAVWYPWNFVTVAAREAPMIVTVHDLAPMLRLDHRWWKVLKRLKYARRYRRTVATADWLLTDAEFTRQELVRRVGADGRAISVAPLAADDPATPDPPAIRPAVAAVGRGPFFLTVGGQEGRKNLGRVYEAMDRLWADGCDIPLVQCGPPPSAETRRRQRAPWLTHLGYVSEGELAALYRQTTALIYPSRYEGFGLPVLEAMRWGAPVICADAASLPEVAGNAALYVPWQETSALAEAMARCARSDALRATLRERGRVQAARFSWARTARMTYEGFQRARQRRWQRAQQ